MGSGLVGRTSGTYSEAHTEHSVNIPAHLGLPVFCLMVGSLDALVVGGD